MNDENLVSEIMQHLFVDWLSITWKVYTVLGMYVYVTIWLGSRYICTLRYNPRKKLFDLSSKDKEVNIACPDCLYQLKDIVRDCGERKGLKLGES